jgi:hypothetical protein|tara:strand:+ start:1666 stop:1908 length:243 start_codon:yes stop_codon:yes gene_type:complete
MKRIFLIIPYDFLNIFYNLNTKNYNTNDNSFLECISTEFIPWSDYGEGSTYSLFENACACAEWIRNDIIKTSQLGEKNES